MRVLRHREGFSFLEVLVGLTILSFGLLALLGVMVINIEVIKQNELRNVAVSVAKQALERLKAGEPVNAVSGNYVRTVGGIQVTYRVDATVVDVGENRSEATVDVRWFMKGATKSYRVSSIVQR